MDSAAELGSRMGASLNVTWQCPDFAPVFALRTLKGIYIYDYIFIFGSRRRFWRLAAVRLNCSEAVDLSSMGHGSVTWLRRDRSVGFLRTPHRMTKMN